MNTPSAPGARAPPTERVFAVGGIALAEAVMAPVARILISMDRDRVLPGVLSRVHPCGHSPHVAVCAQGTLTLAVGLPLGIWLGPGSARAYGFTGAVGAVAIVLVWVL